MNAKLSLSPEELEALAALRPKTNLSGFGLKLKNWVDENKGKRAFNAVRNSDTLELTMLDVIGQDVWTGGGITSDSVQAKLDANLDAKTIKILMNTPGGDAWEGIAIRSLLARHGARVEVEVVGLCASAGTIVAMAGDSVSMHEGTMWMVHRAWTFALGNAQDFSSISAFLTKLDTSMVDLYHRRTGRERADLQALVEAETWMTASEAVSEKFATSVIPAKSGNDGAKAAAVAGVRAMQRPSSEQRISLRAMHAPENRFLIANFRHGAAASLGESWPIEEAEQHDTISRYLHAVATNKGITDEGRKRRTETCRKEMEALGIPLLPELAPNAA